MILDCPSCATRYLVASEQIAPRGRLVRCGVCHHTWHQEPAEEVPLEVEPAPRTAEAGPSQARAAGELIGERAASEARATSELRPIPRGSNLPAFPPRPRRRTPVLGWVVLVLAVAALLYGTFVERARIVEFWPPAGRLFMLLGVMPEPVGAGLEIRAVTSERASENGVAVLRIAGEVVNISGVSRDVPPLVAVLEDARKRKVQQWTFKAGETKLLPGEAAKFSTSVDNPPDEATDIDVEFLPVGG
ncbi:MAG TPA: MJ0042-type zinc finger domain-containing protein [Alphaproteobacteria bacterium]|nr:MJ0042-type zinc finger domain-containing protein [Alphaproteobacteria bacterium]